MKEILLTSSVLIAALLVLRRLFRNKISRRVQYALWGLVLLRLLVPFSLPGISGSILSLSEPARESVSMQLSRQTVYVLPVNRAPISDFPSAYDTEPGEVVPSAQSFGYPVLNSSGDTVTTYAERLTAAQVLLLIWKIGIGVMACWFIFSNLLFWRKLCKARTPYRAEGCKYPVYLVENGLPSPCLFGLFRPAIYLTPASLASPDALRHVLAHEETHARHLDPVWAFLRSVCLAVYWFDPLVWWAALASRTDCELACDEGALRRLGEEERIPYGRTLLSLISVRKAPVNPMLSATTMTAGKRQLKDRITRIAENRKTVGAALFAVILIATLVCAVTFTGAKTPENSLSSTEVWDLTASLSEGRHIGFLCSTYTRPAEIDVYRAATAVLPNEGATSRERQLVMEACGGEANLESLLSDPETVLFKCSKSSLDAYLTEYTGQPMVSNPVGIDRFTYLPEYDAYYVFTNTLGSAMSLDKSTASAERDGGFIRLHYWVSISVDGQEIYGKFCLTLQEQPDGGYWFVSNQPEIPEDSRRPLTSEELAYFNNEFFTESYGSGENRRAQFLTSVYDRPEDIDLFQLCYCGTNLPEEITPDERRRVVQLNYGGVDPGTDLIKISYQNLVEFLEQNTGVANPDSLHGLEKFAWLGSHGAYYHFHGDTNVNQVTFTSGTRDGNLIHLYYDGAAASGEEMLSGSFHLTLKKRPGGGYWFVSNQLAGGIPTAYPSWEPELVIPLDDAQPYTAPAVELKTYGGRYVEMLDGADTGVDTYALCVMRTEHGNLHFAVQSILLSSWPSTYFLEASSDTYAIEHFRNLFGHDGLSIYYEASGRFLIDYYYFQEDGTPVLLLRTPIDTWNWEAIDLEGDGNKEWVTGAGDDYQIFFQRDGQIYQLDLLAAVSNAWTKAEHIHFGTWNTSARCISLYAQVLFEKTEVFSEKTRGFIGGPDSNHTGTAFRYLYFDGENLRLYKDQRLYPNHFAENIDVSADVQDAAKSMVMKKIDVESLGQGLANGDIVTISIQFDNWRVSLLEGPYTIDFYGCNFQVWRIDYQLHTPTPEYVVLAGGRYVTEDGWVSPGYPGCDWLIFQTAEDGSRKYLYSVMKNDCTPDDERFWQEEAYRLEELGLLSLDQFDGPALLNIFARDPAGFLNGLAERPAAQRETIAQSLGEFIAVLNPDGEWESAYDEQWARIIDDVRIHVLDITEAGKAVWTQITNAALRKLSEQN